VGLYSVGPQFEELLRADQEGKKNARPTPPTLLSPGAMLAFPAFLLHYLTRIYLSRLCGRASGIPTGG
jgi:hypothetical protein